MRSTGYSAALLLSGLLLAPLEGVRGQEASWSQCPLPAADTARRAERRSIYVAMDDGIRLATDLFLPTGLRPDERLPSVLVATRYWRAADGQPPSPFQHGLVQRGYAVVQVDVRGTGASFGTWRYPWSPREVADLGTMVRWIGEQPWSDGTVGGTAMLADIQPGSRGSLDYPGYFYNAEPPLAAASGGVFFAALGRADGIEPWFTKPGAGCRQLCARDKGMNTKRTRSEKSRPHISRLTVARLYNLGNYEHVRYELTVDIPSGSSARDVFLDAASILAGLRPTKLPYEYETANRVCAKLHESLSEQDKDNLPRYSEMLKDVEALRATRKGALERLDDLGGVSKRSDLKLDWDSDTPF